MVSALTVSSQGQSMPVEQEASSIVRGTARVLESMAGKPTLLVLDIDASSGTTLSSNGVAQNVPFPLAGQSVTVRVQGDVITGATQSGGAAVPLDAEHFSGLRPFIIFDDALLPGRAVAVGDVWQASIRDEQFDQANDLELSLASVDDSDALTLATLNTRGTITSEQPGSIVRGEVTGVSVVDVATGITVATYGEGTMSISGELAQSGQIASIRGTGTLRVKRALAYGDVPRGVASLSESTPSSTLPPTRRKAPATAQAGDPRLVGVFKGESVYRGATYSNTQLYWLFDGAGGVYYGAQTHWGASARDYNQDLVWTAGGTTAGSGDRGRWRTDGGFLTIEWENGNVARYAYGFEPNGALVFRNAQTRKLINFYDRVR